MSHAIARDSFVRPRISLSYDNDLLDSVKSLPELIEFAATHNKDHIFGLQACSGSDTISWSPITFGQFQRAVEYASEWLIQSRTSAGRIDRADNIAPVAVLLNSDITIFLYLAALVRIGTPALLLSPRLSPTAVAHLLDETGASAVLTNGHLYRVADEVRMHLSTDTQCSELNMIVSPTFFDFDQDRRQQASTTPPIFKGHEANDLNAIILHTSGTTGLPKPIYHSQAYILLYATCHRLPPQKEPFRFNVSTLPLYHGFGFLAPCLSLSIGMPFALLPSTTVPTAKSALSALRATGARYMLTVPSILEDILRATDADGLDNLRDLHFLVIGGAPVKASINRTLVRARVNVLNHWGATELGPLTPIEVPQRGYDSRYLVLRNDTDLKLIPADDGSNTFRLVGKPPGWKEAFVVQDFLDHNPQDQTKIRILGRADDLLVLSTGEKVRSTVLEREITNHPAVNDALTFGSGKNQLGLIIELTKGVVASSVSFNSRESTTAVIDKLGFDSFIQKGNNLVDRHARISKDMVILTSEDKPLKRTDKGTVARKDNYELFAEEIKSCYQTLEAGMAAPLPTPDLEAGMALRRTIRNFVWEIGVHLDGKSPDATEFFQAGMDSLQAMQLRNAILGRLRATAGVMNNLPNDFVFTHPCVDKLFLVLSSLFTGAHKAVQKPMTIPEESRIAAMNAMVNKYKHILQTIRSTTSHTKPHPNRGRVSKNAKVVVLTGSTGTLGCSLLARFAKDPTVSKVICLNRPSSIDPRNRQRDQLIKRGVELGAQEWSKVTFIDCNLYEDDISLDGDAARRLIDVTHIVHNAWPVNFSWTLTSLEPQIKGLVNLIRIAWRSAWHKKRRPVRLMFLSSIAVVGRYPLITPGDSATVPECSVGPAFTIEMGYAEAKWVCETLVTMASTLFSGTIRGCNVRIGQVTGSEGLGAWNEMEHIPILIGVSRELGALPLLDGSLSWLPANRVASSVVELLFSQKFLAVYHVENPSRQPCAKVMEAMADIMEELTWQPRPVLISYPEWLIRVRQLGNESENVAFPLITFFERDFQRLATGKIVLGTTRAVQDSVTMATSGPLERRHFEEYLTYWKSLQVL